MSSGNNNTPIVNPGVCRCCRAVKKCRLLTHQYTFMDTKEVYSDMFVDCFGLLVSFVHLKLLHNKII